MRAMKLVCGFACLIAFQSAWAESLVIKNVRIHPITSPEIVKGEVLIVDGKIAGVGKKVSGRSAKVIDGRGLQLYPGMINAATNIGLEEIGSLRDSVDLDEIGEFNPQLMAQMAFNPTSIHISVTRTSGITSVLSLPGTGGNGGAVNGQQTVFAGQGALMHLNGWTWEDMLVKPGAVLDMNFPEIRSPPQRGYLAPGAVPPKGFSALEKEYRKNLAEIGNFMEEARRYKKAKEAGNSDFKADPKLEAMIPVLNGRRRIFVRASTERAIKDAVAFADAHRVQIAIAAPQEIGGTGPLLKAHNIPVVLGNTLDLPQRRDDPYDSSYTLPARFYRAGVKICFGTFDVQFARNLPFQAAAAVAFGLPYEEALKAVTENPAEILGAQDRLGSIEEGKIADLILTDGDPLEATTTVKMEFINGKEVTLENRQTELYEKYLNRQ
jgi:imidazolonepropionase-like amidohydrolase